MNGFSSDPCPARRFTGSAPPTILDTSLSAAALEAKVEAYAAKPNSDGITIDGAGNIYVTDIENQSVGVIGTDRQYRILHTHGQMLSWPDGFAFGPDNQIYVTVNQLPDRRVSTKARTIRNRRSI